MAVDMKVEIASLGRWPQILFSQVLHEVIKYHKPHQRLAIRLNEKFVKSTL